MDCNDLDDLEPKYPSLAHNDSATLALIEAEFKRMLLTKRVSVRGIPLQIDPYNQWDEELALHLNADFLHVVTRKNESKRRVLVPERAVRAHWISTIITLLDCDQIKHFQYRESDGTIRDYIHFDEKDHVIVLENYHSHYRLITSFSIDDDSYRRNIMRKYKNRVK
jgi:hypothetical protein